MNGPEHYREAQRLLYQAGHDGGAYFTEEAGPDLAAAQVHATLALTAAHAVSTATGWAAQQWLDEIDGEPETIS